MLSKKETIHLSNRQNNTKERYDLRQAGQRIWSSSRNAYYYAYHGAVRRRMKDLPAGEKCNGMSCPVIFVERANLYNYL